MRKALAFLFVTAAIAAVSFVGGVYSLVWYQVDVLPGRVLVAETERYLQAVAAGEM